MQDKTAAAADRFRELRAHHHPHHLVHLIQFLTHHRPHHLAHWLAACASSLVACPQVRAYSNNVHEQGVHEQCSRTPSEHEQQHAHKQGYPGSWNLDPESWVLDPGSRILDPGCPGSRYSGSPGPCIWESGTWIRDPGS